MRGEAMAATPLLRPRLLRTSHHPPRTGCRSPHPIRLLVLTQNMIGAAAIALRTAVIEPIGNSEGAPPAPHDRS